MSKPNVPGLRSIFTGDVEAAHSTFAEAVAMGELYREPELTTLARIGQGRCAIYTGQVDRGIALLDEAMVAVAAREISPIAVGDAYCPVIEGCHELLGLHRAEQWTAAPAEWCDTQPELVLYCGECLIHPSRDHAAARRGGRTRSKRRNAPARPDGSPSRVRWAQPPISRPSSTVSGGSS